MKGLLLGLLIILLMMLVGCSSQYTELLDKELAVRSNALEFTHGCVATAIATIPDLKKNPLNFMSIVAGCSQSGGQFALDRQAIEGLTNDDIFVKGCIVASLELTGMPNSVDAKQALLKQCEELLDIRRELRKAK